MPKKNKAPTNGFYYFMVDYQNRHSKKISLPEASKLAGPIWERMGPVERKPFNNLAARNREREKGGKLTALNEDMDLVLKQEEEKKIEEKAMQKDIEQILKKMMYLKTISEENFHLIHINTFCRSSDLKYYPAEIGIIRFNLQDGVIKNNVYHQIIQPGNLPRGYSYTAKTKSDETHKLPIPYDGQNNLELVINDIIQFLLEGETASGAFPPIYTSDKDRPMVTEVLRQLCEEYDYEQQFQVYSLQYLLYTLRNTAEGQKVWQSVNSAVLELERDVFDFTPGISCDFHEDTDVPIYCSQSIVIRFVYIMCDNCCTALDIPLIPGKHVPSNSKIVYQSRCNSSASFVTAKNQVFDSPPGSVAGSTISVMTFNDFDECNDTSATCNDDDDGWTEAPSRRAKSQSVCSNGSMPQASTPNLEFLSQASGESTSQLRRPYSVSASVSGAYSKPSPQLGRGRGRGRR